MRHVHTHRATHTYVKSCTPKNNRSNKKKTLFFFKKDGELFLKPPDLFTAAGNSPYSVEV